MVRSLLLEARDRGHSVEAAFLEHSRERGWIDDFTSSGIPVAFAPGASKVDLTRWIRGNLLDGDEPTVLHTHFTTFDVPAALAARGRADTAVFWHVHSTLQTDLRARSRNVAKFSTLGRGVDAILCPAENIAEDVRKRLGPAEDVHFFPSALDVGSYPTKTAEDRLEARRELDLPADALIVLHFGWHWYLKGGDIFLATIAEMGRRGHDRPIIGLERGGGEDARREAEAAGRGDTVRFIPPVEDIRLLFAAADVVLSSSRSEGMAYSVLESLSCGTPVVATQIPGHTFVARYVHDCRISSREPRDLADH